MTVYRITRDGKPVGIHPADSLQRAATPLAAAVAFVPPGEEIIHAGSKTAAVRSCGFTYLAEEVEDA